MVGPGPQVWQRITELASLSKADLSLEDFARHKFISLERRETGQLSGSVALTKACCVSSAPPPHLVILTVLKMYPSCLPCSHFRTWGSPRGKALINTMH